MTPKTNPAGISAIVTEGSGEIYLDVLQDGRTIRVGPVDRRSLLAALGAEPDESDYAEVIEENNRLGRKLSAVLRERDAALGAEPDESDYAEVIEENNRLGWKLSAALRERDAALRERDAALGAEPDESDYAEVIEENNRLGRKLSAALRERDTARLRIQEILSDRDSWKARAEEARKDRDAALEALRTAEDAPEDQVQIDRSWALEKAGEVLGRLAAVGVDARACGVSLLPLAEWILGGEEDRG